jgi:drug/metabolite transporter (DMT)-like permease
LKRKSPPIPLSGGILLVVLCFVWGGNIVSIKVSNEGLPPLLAAALRSAVASLLLWLYAAAVRERVFFPRGLVKHGAAIGMLFGAEFLFLYWGLSFTHASRAVIFLYTHPLWTALLAHFVLSDDRLHASKIAGIALAFAGLALVFGFRSGSPGSAFWLGDVMELFAGFLWAATTVYIKRFVSTAPVSPFQTLFAQLFFSIPLLAIGACCLESTRQVSLNAAVLAAVVYQCVVVACASYLAWFRMIHRYAASSLAAFTFLTPFFGVLLSGIVLREPVTLMLWAGLGLVAGGVYLVNRPAS